MANTENVALMARMKITPRLNLDVVVEVHHPAPHLTRQPDASPDFQPLLCGVEQDSLLHRFTGE